MQLPKDICRYFIYNHLHFSSFGSLMLSGKFFYTLFTDTERIELRKIFLVRKVYFQFC